MVQLRPPTYSDPRVDNDLERPEPWGWSEHIHDGRSHMIPSWDLGGHYNIDCPCGVVDDGYGFLHNAFDGRERYEDHGARPH